MLLPTAKAQHLHSGRTAPLNPAECILVLVMIGMVMCMIGMVRYSKDEAPPPQASGLVHRIQGGGRGHSDGTLYQGEVYHRVHVSRMFRDLKVMRQTNMGIHPLLDGRVNGRDLTVIDVGANAGQDYSLPAIRAGFKVYAFEPVPDVWHSFLATFDGGQDKERLSVVSVVPGEAVSMPPGHELMMNHCFFVMAAASNQTSKQVIRAQNEMSSLVDQSFYKDGDKGKQVLIATVPVDEVVDEDIFLFKIDTQGFEYHVLKGAEKLLRGRKVRYLTMEFWPEGIKHSGIEPVEVLRFVHELGFECADVAEEKTPDGQRHVRDARDSSLDGYVDELMRIPAHDEFIGLWDELFCWRDV
jgi:FkbM family methyltransferase